MNQQKVMTPNPPTCGVCKGAGVVKSTVHGAGGPTLTTVVCPACRGRKTGSGLMTK